MIRASRLSIASIQERLNTRLIGRKILLFPEIDSTNAELLRQAASGFPEGGVLLAESQRQGKGRLGRRWISPPGVNLYFSILLRPENSPFIPLVSLLSAVAASEGIEEASGLCPKIKWPNDLLLVTPAGERKTGGILLEITSPPSRVLAVGIGVNVNLRLEQLPSEVAEGATSLFQLLQQEVDRNQVAAELLNRFEAWYTCLLRGEAEAIRSAWTKRSCTIGRKVRAFRSRETITGVAEGITTEGALVLRGDDGSTQAILAADVIHLRDAD